MRLRCTVPSPPKAGVMPMATRLLICLAMWLASGASSAASFTWTISGGTFADGGTFSGSFDKDTALPFPRAWNLDVAGGGSSFPAFAYTPENSTVFPLDWPPNTELTFHFVSSSLGSRQLRLTPLGPLDGSVATVPLSLLNSQAAVECYNCTPFRNITGGSLVLAAVTPTLVLESITPDPTVVGGTTTATISIDGVAAFGPPTGSITILDSNGDVSCVIALPATSCNFSPTAPGGLTLFALYPGDANYTSVISNERSFSTVPAAVTTVTLAPITPFPTAVGATTTATVVVDPVAGFPPPTGLVTVYLNSSGSTLCTITLPATTCTFAPASGGVQSVGSQFSGDANYASAFSNLVAMTVAPVPPVVTLVSLAANPTAVGTLTTATITVDTNPVFGPPTGTITVFGGIGNILCTATLPSSSCSFTPTVPGNQTVVARYEGDANYDNGLSNPLVLVVRAPPSIAKAFVPLGILVDGTSTLTFTLTNPNAATALTGVGFTDTLPAGVVVATPNGLASTCGGTVTAAEGSGSIVQVNGGIAAAGSCTISVNVTGSTGGLKANTTGAVTSVEGGTGGAASAFLVVVDPPLVSPPTIAKAFGAASMIVGGTTTLAFSLTNPNPGLPLSGVGFTDTLPAGLTVADSAGAMCGGTLTTSGGNTITLAGATIAATGTCAFTVTVTGAAAGLQDNLTGAVTSTEGGAGGTASASVRVGAPPTIEKAFGVAELALNKTTSLVFRLTNPDASAALTGVGFTDILPAGLTVADGSSAACEGTRTTSGGNSIALADATIAPGGTCMFAVTVTATTVGAKNNVTGVVSSIEGGTGATAAASLTVVAPPTIEKAFGVAVLALNATTSLTFTLTNPDASVALTGVAFTDTLPAGLTVDDGVGAACGGTQTASGGNTITLAGATIAPGGTCAFSVTVTATTPGTQNNVTGPVTSIEGGSGATASASVTVVDVVPPTIEKSFGAASIVVDGTTTLTFTLTNPNAQTALTGVGFTDTLPAGLVVATPNGLTGLCGGGTISAAAGATSLSLAGATLATGASCVFAVNVQAVAVGVQDNTTDAVTSANAGPGNAANASITVLSPMAVAPIPSLSTLALAVLAILVMLLGLRRKRAS